MKKKLFILILALVVAFLFAIPVSAETQDGWVEEYGNMTYYENGERVTNCIKEIDGDYYYFNYDGYKYEGSGMNYLYLEIDNEYRDVIIYVTEDNGKLLTNAWREEENGPDTLRYYMGANGIAYTNGIYEIDGAKYYFDSNATMCTGIIWAHDDNLYFANEDGKIAMNQWFQFAPYSEDPELYWFYASEDGTLYRDGLHKIGDYYYFFDYSGTLLNGFINDYENDLIYYADPYNDSRIVTNGWFQAQKYEDENELYWFYASEDGTLYNDGLHKIGDYYYYFDYSGGLYSGFIDDYENDLIYYADPNNDYRIATNGWFQAKRYDWDYNVVWFYATEDGTLYHNTIENIGGTFYGFYDSGEMADDATFNLGYWDNELDEYISTGYYRAKAGGALYINGWYKERYGGWYYYAADGKAALGLVNIGGTDYFFDTNDFGQMLEDDYTYYQEDDTLRFLVADEDGAITEVYNNNWAKVGDYWYYVQDNEFCNRGIYEIDGAKYGFNYSGRMYENSSFWLSVYDEETGDYLYEDVYFAKADGTVAQSEWCLEESEYGGFWWYYAGDNGTLLTSGLYELDGKRYWFGMDGSLIDDTIYYDGEDVLYICKVNKDGSGGYVNETEGWYICEGDWIYVNAEGKVHEGWLNDQYYLDPEMYFGSYILMPNYESEDDFYVELYLFNKNGTAEKITADGFYSAKAPNYSDFSYTVYLKDGKVVMNDWVNANGNWYYFNEECRMVSDESYIVNGVPYFFNLNGVMADDGWVRSSEGDWYYAYPDGSLFTGVDSANYLFDDFGALVINRFYTAPDGNIYFTDGNGIIIHTAIDGWNEIRGDRYYFEDGEMLRDCTSFINDELYAFNYNGKMIRNDTYYGQLFGADGKQIINDWLYADGKWYYAYEDDACYSGIYEINGKEYYFEDYVLQQNVTQFNYYDDAIITTDSEGVVISTTNANGWIYSVDGDMYPYGEVYYYKDGNPFDGWVGSYYIEDGRMLIDTTLEWNDSFYYVDEKGVYVSGGWYELSENEWIYARNDGSLYYDEWLFYNGAWYYFGGTRMFADGITFIDGAYHSFDENGVWLGESDTNYYDNLPDGWFYYQNDWYYINANEPARECELYIDGAWYAFNYDGSMIENRVFGNHYYLDGGKRAEYTGWVKLKTGWSYFYQDHSIAYGWLKDGNQYYFLDYVSEHDEAADKYYMSYAAVENDYRAIDGKLYYFNASCALQYEATDNGWYQASGEWYCIQNGEVCYDGIYKIGNVYYAFNYDGLMLHNQIYDGNYFDESGAMVTDSGWHYAEVDGEAGWIYIFENGHIAMQGIFLIDGREYAFSNCFWVE